jgi:ABC-type multidrug transport system fused ATPase/permease subunit
MGFTGFHVSATYAFGIWYGFKLYLDGSISGAAVMQVLLLFNLSVETFTESLGSITDIHAANVAAFHIFKLVDEETQFDLDSLKPAPPSLVSFSKKTDSDAPIIEFLNVCFSYDSRPDTLILDNFSLKINQGQVVALVGSSGSGKSTVVGLITRLFSIKSGNILLKGQNIESFDSRKVRRLFGVVSQEPVLFDTTIFQNIAWGAGENASKVTLDQVMDACKQGT